MKAISVAVCQSHLINPAVKMKKVRIGTKWFHNMRDGVKHTSGPLSIMHQKREKNDCIKGIT